MAEDSEIRFGGVPTIPPPEVFENVRKKWSPQYKAYRQAYEAFIERPENVGIYADPKGQGATLEQIWMLFPLLSGIEPYCLLASPLPADQVKRITRLVQCSAEELVQSLMKIQGAAGKIGASTCIYDGTTGHCIVIWEYDKQRDRFIYHDPWPERSLLCKENNMADVDAQPEGTRWSVTSKELERVIFASFVFPPQWARIQGEEFDLLYDQWQESEFFEFFHLKQIDTSSGDGKFRRVFAPGPFKDDIVIIVDTAESGKVGKAALLLKRNWVMQNSILAIDISKSFVLAFAPLPDKEAYGKISQDIWNLRDPNFAQTMINQGSDESQKTRCVRAFMGLVNSASMNTDFGILSFDHTRSDETDILEITFTLF